MAQPKSTRAIPDSTVSGRVTVVRILWGLSSIITPCVAADLRNKERGGGDRSNELNTE